MNEYEYWLRFWTTFGMIIVMIVFIISVAVCKHKTIMVEHGYEETVLPGTGSICWRKAQCNLPPRHGNSEAEK